MKWGFDNSEINKLWYWIWYVLFTIFHWIVVLRYLKEMYVLDNVRLIVRALNMNIYDNENKFYGISTNFIRKLIDLFFIITGENYQQLFPWTICIPVKKVQIWNVYMDPCTYSWMNTPHIMINNQTFLRQTLTKNWYVVMDIQTMFHRMYWLLGFQK